LNSRGHAIYDGGIVGSLLAFFLSFAAGSDSCKRFDAEEFARMAQEYVDSSRKSSKDGLFLGSWPRAVVDIKTVRRPTPDEDAQDVIGVVPIGIGIGSVDLLFFADCSIYPMPFR
jgi:hypothetical protein